MTCLFCEREAVAGGRAPKNVKGLMHLRVCEVHRKKIEQLNFTPIDLMEIKRIELKEAAEKK